MRSAQKLPLDYYQSFRETDVPEVQLQRIYQQKDVRQMDQAAFVSMCEYV